MRHSFFCIDAHTCGNPVRLVAGGAPMLPHAPMGERRQMFLRDHDWVRRALMFEPRGHDVMSGSILYPPSDEQCDAAVLFIEVSGCLPMCGHGTIGTVTIAIEEGLIAPKIAGRVVLEAPAGQIVAHYDEDGGRVTAVRLLNIPSYLHARDIEIEVDGMGTLTIDVAYGGNYYAIVEPQRNFAGLDALSAADLVAISPRRRSVAQAAVQPVHPEDPRIARVTHVMWCDKPTSPRATARNAVFYGDKAIDRSPCGTGTSARMAQLVARDRLAVGDHFVHESIIGTMFDCEVVETATVGNYPAIRPLIGGWARITGHNTIFVDTDDPLAHGFQVS